MFEQDIFRLSIMINQIDYIFKFGIQSVGTIDILLISFFALQILVVLFMKSHSAVQQTKDNHRTSLITKHPYVLSAVYGIPLILAGIVLTIFPFLNGNFASSLFEIICTWVIVFLCWIEGGRRLDNESKNH